MKRISHGEGGYFRGTLGIVIQGGSRNQENRPLEIYV